MTHLEAMSNIKNFISYLEKENGPITCKAVNPKTSTRSTGEENIMLKQNKIEKLLKVYFLVKNNYVN